MTVFVHKDAYDIEENTSVYDFISLVLKNEGTGIALAVNENIIPKDKWISYILKENDKLLIIKAVAGG
ncbi:MAG: sulfur carrier protein ThiS [Chitinophagales bacterium]|nr:sulfur carrier protein ThiS [Chitinophagales bacterium]